MQDATTTKAIWLSEKYQAVFNGVKMTAQVSSKGFIGVYNDLGQYQFGLKLETAQAILGAEHPVCKKSDEIINQSRVDKKIAKQATRALINEALKSPEALELLKKHFKAS